MFFTVATTGLIAQTNSFSFVFLNKKIKPDSIGKGEQARLMEGHMANITRLAGEGKLRAAGPFQGGGGIFVFNTTSVDETKEWLSTDPAVKANRWDVEILPYRPIVGSVCKAPEPYEMVTYHFIRFWADIKKFNVREAPTLIVQHETYWKNLNETNALVTFASFGEMNGDILISTNAIDETVLSNDPAVKAGLIRFEKKTLWIAKGSFCENTEKKEK
jgi:uncharacterized protein YciI